MSRVEFPSGMLAVSRVPHWLLRRGLILGPLRLIETVGPRSGRTHSVPVAVLRFGGERWLVSPFGETAWVRHVRAGSTVRLGKGRNPRPVTLATVEPDRVPELLRVYRRRFGFVPFVRAAFDARSSGGVAAFAAEADRHPVFRISKRP